MLFTGKLMLLLLVYIREDAVVVRQPIYGLLIGNLLLVALAYLMRSHALLPLAQERVADFGFLNEMGVLMVWGTASCSSTASSSSCSTRSRAHGSATMLARSALSGVVVLTFDQLAFFAGLHVLTGAGVSVLSAAGSPRWGRCRSTLCWSASICAGANGRRPGRSARASRDVFDVLTYRERYEDLLAEARRKSAELGRVHKRAGMSACGGKADIKSRTSRPLVTEADMIRALDHLDQ